MLQLLLYAVYFSDVHVLKFQGCFLITPSAKGTNIAMIANIARRYGYQRSGRSCVGLTRPAVSPQAISTCAL